MVAIRGMMEAKVGNIQMLYKRDLSIFARQSLINLKKY
jgi:hypothetical protein